MSDNILLVEDDNRLAGMVSDYLGENGFAVTIADCGVKGIDLHTENGFDAIILDLMLPDIVGLEVCRTIKAHDTVPIIMLTAKGDPMDRIIGLEIGADDYLPKPFEPRELLARLRAILRRVPPCTCATSSPPSRSRSPPAATGPRIRSRDPANNTGRAAITVRARGRGASNRARGWGGGVWWVCAC